MTAKLKHLAIGALVLLGACAAQQVAPSSAPAAAANPQVTIRNGALRGKSSDGILSFLGIPYAAPPVGALRWQPPQAAAPWRDVRDATAYGAPCAQPTSGAFAAVSAGQKEDCLTLNVWTPNTGRNARLPVMVYIHGGGFIGGSGTIQSFDGSALARKGVIVVTINYRLGIFGFFAHPELTHESPHHASGNYGLADQIASLQWVHDNIRAFGGDPARVTIFGQSAGSISVLDLMTSPLSRDLFHGVIAESGTPWLARGKTPLAEAEAQGAAFTTAQGVSIEQLRAMPADDLIVRWTAAHGASWPIVDGWVLPEAPSDVFSAHREMHVPLMTGNNAREGFGAATDANLPDQLRSTFGDGASRAQQVYAPLTAADPILGTSANTFETDIMFRCPAVVLQTWHAAQRSPVYAYQFEDSLPGLQARGSQHSDEVSFVFGTLDMMSRFTTHQPTPAPAARLSDQMMTYWTNFAKTGDPNGPDAPQWPRFTTTDRAFQHLNSSGIRSDVNLRADACALYLDSAMERLMTRSIF